MVTKLEMLLAVAMSEFFQTSHVLFLPPGKEYVQMLKVLRNKKYVTLLASEFYVLTLKGRRYIIRQNNAREITADKKIDEFVDKL